MNCYGFLLFSNKSKRVFINKFIVPRITQNRLMKQLYNNLYHHDILPFLTLSIAT